MEKAIHEDSNPELQERPVSRFTPMEMHTITEHGRSIALTYRVPMRLLAWFDQVYDGRRSQAYFDELVTAGLNPGSAYNQEIMEGEVNVAAGRIRYIFIQEDETDLARAALMDLLA